MIIPRHIVCDFCNERVGVNKGYITLKSKDMIVASAGSCSIKRTYHVCEDCMMEFRKYLKSKLKQ